MNRPFPIRAWLQLARLSNLPTIVSNTLAALALTWMIAAPDQIHLSGIGFGHAALGLTLAMGLIYVAGMLLNDLLDFRWDQTHRPQRPLVQGSISRPRAWWVVIICFTTALMVLTVYPAAVMFTGTLLLLSVVLYNLTHKRWFWPAAGLMGACRALIFLTVASLWLTPLSGGWWMLAGIAVISGLYTVGISLIARHETGSWPGSGRVVAIILLLLPFTALFWIDASNSQHAWVFAAAVMLLIGLGRVIWLAWQQPPATMAVVHGLLAGFCLLDAWWMALAGWPAGVVLAWVGYALTARAHRYIAGT